jgi:zinc protease
MIKILSLSLLMLFLILPRFALAADIPVQVIQTPKGLSAWLVQDKTLPILSLQFAFREAGSVRDPADKQGLVRLLSNTLDEGAGDFDSTQFQKALSDHSISLSFFASRDHFGGSLKTLTRYQDKAVSLLALALQEPRFDSEALQRMVNSNLARIRSDMTDPDWMASRLLNDTVYAGHPYGQNSGGTLSSLPKISAEDLKKFVAENFCLERLDIVVVGNITAEQTSMILDQIFAPLPQTCPKTSKMGLVSLPAQSRTILFPRAGPQTVLQLAWAGLDDQDPDYYAAEIFDHILGSGGFGSRLTETIREKQGLTYGIFSQLVQQDYADLLVIQTSTRNETVPQMLESIKAETQNIEANGVTRQEIINARNYLIGSTALRLTSTDRIASVLLSLKLDDKPKNYFALREEKLNQVTPEDVKRVAERVLGDKAVTTILVGSGQGLKVDEIRKSLPNVE